MWHINDTNGALRHDDGSAEAAAPARMAHSPNSDLPMCHLSTSESVPGAQCLSELLGSATLLTPELEQRLLDTDLREVGIGSFSEELAKGRDAVIREAVILQLVSMRNVAQPTMLDEEEGHTRRRLMLLTFTDGRMPIRAIDPKGVTTLPHITAPGTKILLKGGSVRKGIVLLESGSLQVLGGVVASLAEEWEFQQAFGKSRPKGHEEEEAPGFEHFNPARPPTRIHLGTFSTFDVLSKSIEGDSEGSSSVPERRAVASEKATVFQNRDAVREKLLSEMPEPSSSTKPPRGRGRGRGRGRSRDVPTKPQTQTLTLEEYEAQQHSSGTVNDAMLARELDKQLNMDTDTAEKDLMASMFSYTPSQDAPSAPGPRGRGRGRGRSRGRRGRGRR